MKAKEIAEKLDFKLLAGAEGEENIVESFYVCDLLSWVMGRAKENQMWFTVMGNVNAVAVATLKDVSAIVLTENAPLDEDAKARANQMDIPIYVTELDSATALLKAHGILNEKV